MSQTKYERCLYCISSPSIVYHTNSNVSEPLYLIGYTVENLEITMLEFSKIMESPKLEFAIKFNNRIIEKMNIVHYILKEFYVGCFNNLSNDITIIYNYYKCELLQIWKAFDAIPHREWIETKRINEINKDKKQIVIVEDEDEINNQYSITKKRKLN